MSNTRAKGVELSMNTMIIAALGLLILILLTIFLINGFGKTNVGTKCEPTYGVCAPSCPISKNSKDYTVPSPWTCDGGQVCCTILGGG